MVRRLYSSNSTSFLQGVSCSIQSWPEEKQPRHGGEIQRRDTNRRESRLVEMIKAGRMSQFSKELNRTTCQMHLRRGGPGMVGKEKTTSNHDDPNHGKEYPSKGHLSQHNGIIGRPGIRKIHAIPSTAHGMLKFPVEGGTITLRSSSCIPMECAMISGPSIRPEVGTKFRNMSCLKLEVTHWYLPDAWIVIGKLGDLESADTPSNVHGRVQGDVVWLKNAGATYQRLVDKAFQRQIGRNLEKLLAELSMLTAPKEKEELIIYLAAAKEAISAVLMTEREGKQIPIYFVSTRPTGAEIKLQPMGKIGVRPCSVQAGAVKDTFKTQIHCNHGSADKATTVKLRKSVGGC
ncbi:reverse transcriptase domain-containing protein [Tanacetum coccineum]